MNNLTEQPKEKNKRPTQANQILAYLERGKTLTQLEALEYFQCMRLPSRIDELRQAGHSIETELITTNTGKRVARYSLNQPQEGELNS